MPQFSHLHCHSQFSLLDGAASIPGMIGKAKADNMRAVALTDHGNMFGVFKFVTEAERQGVIPVVGCEFYVVEDRFRKSFSAGDRDRRYHQLMLAKDQNGYQNLSKLCSLGFMEGLYSKYPRIDKELIRQYKEGIIATTCCLGAEVPQAIVHKGEEEAEKIFLEWLEIFGEDYYIELQRHHIPNVDGSGMSQEDVNQVLLKWSKKYNVPVIATNDSHYVDENDWNAHDILLCVNTGSLKSQPTSGPGSRFAFENSQFYFKTQEEMEILFRDVPEALDNTNLIIDKITPPELKRDVLLPHFTLPQGFTDQNEYLRHLSYEGARKRYGEITEPIRERLDFELHTIEQTGYPGYFLIVQDFTSVARKLGVSVGPGRGSAAGSLIAYCIGITNVDPIKYDLLFERFLNPDRVSMPDIDIDFDDIGRQKVIDYVVDKYGKNNVAQIITYGSMAAKSAIRDVGRVLNLPLSQVDRLSKLVPDISLKDVFESDEARLKEKLNGDQLSNVRLLRDIASGNDLEAEVLKEARALEGSVRNTGVHACGVIITPEEITNLVPVTVAKDSDLLLTQFDNDVVETAGLLKMDFLGLRTLSIINTALNLIEERHGVRLDPDSFPLDDPATYELFQKGQTVGIFQFESEGMRKNLRALEPTRFEDLIAMNALYRPGPMDYIPSFIARKKGKEKIEYDDPDMEEYLDETYGITVYQEQVMLLSQKLAGFTKGEADSLRKAMGKKKKDIIDKMKPGFLERAVERGHDLKVMEKVWTDWESFASYAFNKSHATCYSFLAFQTAYLKANYPPEFMAAVLTHNMNEIKKVSFFMDECRNMGITVLGPDVNESILGFSVNAQGYIRFGMAAVKGVGESAAEELIENRKNNGPFLSLFDLTKRVNLHKVNKKSLESLALAGAFDGMEGIHRSMLIDRKAPEQPNGLELALRFGQDFQQDQLSAQASLFGGDSSVQLQEPQLPDIKPWDQLERLRREREVIGMYLSAHPLDPYRLHLDMFGTHNTAQLDNLSELKGKTIRIGGSVGTSRKMTTKTGKGMVRFTLEDYSGSHEFAIFGDDVAKFGEYLIPDALIMITGKVQSRYYNADELELKITQVDFLSDVMEKYLKEIILEIPLEKVNPTVMTHFFEGLNESEGKVRLSLELIDPDDAIKVKMHPRKLKLNLDTGWIRKMEELGLKYRINKLN